MNGQALRIFAHAPRRRSLVRPGRSLGVVRASDELPIAPVRGQPQATAAACSPAPIEKVETVEQIEKIEKIEMVETNAIEHLEQTEKIARVETNEKLEKVERIEPFAPLAAAIEQTILDILASTPDYGETIEAAYRRKERALADVFGALTRSEAATMQRRLTERRDGDALAQRFARLVVDRRTRLLAVLADTPRREARRR